MRFLYINDLVISQSLCLSTLLRHRYAIPHTYEFHTDVAITFPDSTKQKG